MPTAPSPRKSLSETSSASELAIDRAEMTDIERAVTDIGESIRRDIDSNAVEVELPVTARAPDKADLALLSSRPRADHSPADIDEDTLTRALEADVRRDFANMEDSIVRIEDDTGTVREMTVREMLDDIDDDDVFLQELERCVLV